MVFVIAEIGVNWDGEIELAEEMIHKAKQIGCSAVKFQSFTDKMVEQHPEKIRLLRSSINKKNIEEVYQISKKYDIEWMCTPMYPEAVDLIDPYLKRFKIREHDSRTIFEGKKNQIFDNIIRTGKEVLISSKKNPKNSKIFHYSQCRFLYCIPKYPCYINEIDFRNLNDFDGYSNHCTNLLAPLMAAIKGVKIIEIHMTSNKFKKFIDNNVSFDYTEFEKLMELINNLKLLKF